MTVRVRTLEDLLAEGNETFFLEVSYPGLATVSARAKILDDD